MPTGVAEFKGSTADLVLRCRPGDWRNADGQRYVARTCQVPGERFQWCDEGEHSDCAEGFACTLEDGRGKSLKKIYRAPGTYSLNGGKAVGSAALVEVKAAVCVAKCEVCMVKQPACCEALQACGGDKDCSTCLTDCVVEDDPVACWKKNNCMNADPTKPAPNAAFQDIAKCMTGVCKKECGF